MVTSTAALFVRALGREVAAFIAIEALLDLAFSVVYYRLMHFAVNDYSFVHRFIGFLRCLEDQHYGFNNIS